MKRNTKVILATAAILSMAVASCGKKKKKDESTTNADGSTKLTAVTSVAELGLSSALNISVPAAYSKAATSLSLTAAKKSQDACRIGEPISQVSDNINQVGNFSVILKLKRRRLNSALNIMSRQRAKPLPRFGSTTPLPLTTKSQCTCVKRANCNKKLTFPAS